MISICVSVIRGVATRSQKSIKESIVFMPSVRSDTHHKMGVLLGCIRRLKGSESNAKGVNSRLPVRSGGQRFVQLNVNRLLFS